MEPVFFATPDEFRAWLEDNHEQATELLVGYYKVSCEKPSMSWSESVDQALCFGWIDGIRKSIDSESYCIRFTPRKPKSNWSAVNIGKVEELKAKGLMHSAGLEKYSQREEGKSRVYAYEKEPEKLDKALETQFKNDEKAWVFFQAQPPYYRRQMIYWVMSAKQEVTRVRRLEKLMEACKREERI
ncbi:YdeI/OmpD-associated family protein [Catalinimonas sp. 4WD22]|uniref:YdeI/OmpD-associated family protein n=1 Tax=Catalinimonas locisalis TaxID=3133978 RepID=UPI0031018BED